MIRYSLFNFLCPRWFGYRRGGPRGVPVQRIYKPVGEDYPAIYASVKEAEFAAFMGAISRREYEWYL